MLTRVLVLVVLLLVGGVLLARFLRPLAGRAATSPGVSGVPRPAGGRGTVAWRVGGLLLGAALGLRLAVVDNDWSAAGGPVFGAVVLTGVLLGEARRGRPSPRAGQLATAWWPVGALLAALGLVLAVQPGCARGWQFAVGAGALLGAALAALATRRGAGSPHLVVTATGLYAAACLAPTAYATGAALRSGSCDGLPALGWPLTLIGVAGALAAVWFTVALLIPRVRA